MSQLEKVLNYYKLPVDEKIICPFHADKNPSLKIDLDKDKWYCFGCQEGGDALKFHTKMQNILGNYDDIKILMKYQRIVKGTNKTESTVQSNEESLVKKDKAYYRQCLIEAKDYYNGLKTVDWFDDDVDDECVEYMVNRGFKRSVLNKCGAKYTYRDISYPIIFPIKDNGNFKGWVCRSFDPEISSKRKYLYNKGFRRASTIAGNYSNTKIVMLVEGYMDYLKARQNGVTKVGAILGWKITNEQIKKLKAEGVEVIISALDNDECGKKGTKYLKNYFKVIRFPYPKNIKDMGDMNKKTFRKAYEKLEGELQKWD